MSFTVYEEKLLAKLIAIYFHVLNHFGKMGQLITLTLFLTIIILEQYTNYNNLALHMGRGLTK